MIPLVLVLTFVIYICYLYIVKLDKLLFLNTFNHGECNVIFRIISWDACGFHYLCCTCIYLEDLCNHNL
jgi:hypothetical protein